MITMKTWHSKIRFFLFLILPFITFFITSCNDADEPITADEITTVLSVTSFQSECDLESQENITPGSETEIIDTEQSTLDCQITFDGSEISVDSDSTTSNSESLFATTPVAISALPLSQRITLYNMATVASPQVDGEFLGATDVTSNGDQVIVTYNTPGAVYDGAVQVIDVSTPNQPSIISQTVFPGIDVSSAFLSSENILYLAEAQSVDDTGFDTGATLREISLDTDFSPELISDPVNISSFVTTSVVAVGDEIFTVSGNTGGVTKIDADSLEVLDTASLDDARWIDYDEELDTLFVFQGTDGRVTAVDPDTLETTTYNVGGATIEESKSTIQSYGGYLFAAAGDGGTLIVNPDTGAVLETIDNPDYADVTSDREVTNAVSAQDDLFFIANGAFLRVASWEGVDDDTVDVSVAGTLQVNQDESVNGIEYRGDYLVAASGSGGVRIIRVSTNPYLKNFDCDTITTIFCDDFNEADGTEIDSQSSTKWAGRGNSRQVNGTIIDQGGRIESGNRWIKSQDDFDARNQSYHYSAKLYESTYFMVQRNTSTGTRVEYDKSAGTVTVTIGKITKASQRDVRQFSIPGDSTEFVVMHIYQDEDRVQLKVDLPDGTSATSNVITSKDSNIAKQSNIYIQALTSAGHATDTKAFDDVIVEDGIDL
jgi:hypothetical protein